MNYQILALDLDGTLTNSSKEISEPTLKALIEIQEQGKKVVLASGRPTNGVAPLAEQLALGITAVTFSPSTEGALPTARPKKSYTTRRSRWTAPSPYMTWSWNIRIRGWILSPIRRTP